MKSDRAELSYSKTSVAVQEHSFLGEEVHGEQLSDDHARTPIYLSEASRERKVE